YYMIPAEHLPLLQPLRDLGIAPQFLDSIEPGLRSLVEAGYDRALSPGVPAPARLFPEFDVPCSDPPAAPDPAATVTATAEAARKTAAIGRGAKAVSAVEDRDRAGPTRRSGVHLDRKAGHLEAGRRK
ncbi:MAG: PE-PPE domain-containing protein, partial [Mycobacterium sp.]